MLWKLLQDTKAGDKPSHLAVIFDASRASFRSEIYAEYKANRTDPPDDLLPQFPLTREATRAFGVPCIEKVGYEADDLIATYSRLAREAGAKVTIVSSDKDLMQLVRDGEIEMFDPMKSKRFGSAEVIERFGVPPEKVIYVQALAGDSIDNVPGVPGIGVKTAAELIGTYGDLETLLAHATEIKQPKRRESLIANAENARISEKLVTLDVAVPVEEPLAEFGVRDPDPKELIPFLKAMEFSALLKRASVKLGIEDIEVVTGEEIAQIRARRPEGAAPQVAPPMEAGCPGAVVDRLAVLRPIDYGRYETVTDLAALERFIAMAHETGIVGLSVQTDSADPMRARIFGIALAPAPGVAAYIPLAQSQRRRSRLFGRGAGHAEGRAGARAAEASLRRRGRAEGRAQSEIRDRAAAAARASDHTHRRSDADVLCARRRRERPRSIRAFGASSQAQGRSRSSISSARAATA